MADSMQSFLQTMRTVTVCAEANEQAVLTMAAGAERLSALIASVSAVSEQTALGSEEMSANAQEVSASIDNMSAGIEEQSASIQEISAAASELKQMASQLTEGISRFRRDSAAQPGAPSLPLLETDLRKAA
jgi:methyl-accepting chemotaxis protein